MKVITLDESAFEDACRELARKTMSEGAEYTVVGIRQGGAHVGRIVFDELSRSGCANRYFEVSASRKGKSLKRLGLVSSLMKKLPRGVSSMLRVLEHHLVSSARSGSVPSSRNIMLDDDLVAYLAAGVESNEPVSVLLLDDAIDSGSTMKLMLDSLARLSPGSDFSLGVIVVTQKDPVIMPDYHLYDNVLIRFPWSNDFDDA